MKLEFIYDFGQVYLFDAAYEIGGDEYLAALADAQNNERTVGVTGAFVDLLFPYQCNVQTPLEIELHDAEPALDGADEHVVEFPLDLPSGTLRLEGSGGAGEVDAALRPGRFHARWTGRNLQEEEADEYRLQLWPATGDVEVRERTRSPVYA